MRKVLTIICFFTFAMVHAQQVLTIDEAIGLALKKNFDIQIARNSSEIAKINNSAGNAGMLPKVALNGSANYGLYDQTQKSSTTGSVTHSGVKTSSYGANVELTWKLFDGGKMFVTKRKLSEIEALGELKFREQVMQTLFEVVAAYYDIIRQKQQLKAINEAIDYTTQRVKISETAFTSGSRSKTDFLQAKIDLNVYNENAIIQEVKIASGKRLLIALLGKNAGEQITVSDTIPLHFTPNRAEMEANLYAKNPTILQLQKQLEVSKLITKESNRTMLPELNFKAGYYLNNSDNSTAQFLINRSMGPQIGGTLTLPLYAGGDIRRKINLSKIDQQTAQIDLENAKLQLDIELQNALNEFESQQRLVNIETENNGLTKENLNISLQRLNYGQTTSLEVHQAQESFVQSSTRLTNLQYNLKIAEARLKQLLASFDE